MVRFESGPGQKPFNSPYGGVTLAHELGHNYGRFHIDQSGSCGGNKPDAPYQKDYPYNPCSLSTNTGPAAIYGFDPISQTIIPPQTGDLMSYAKVTWISGFNWNAIFGHVPAPAAALKALPKPLSLDSPQVLLVRGFIGPATNDAAFHTFYVLGTNDVNYAKMMSDLDAESGTAVPSDWPYQMVFRDADGNPIQTNNVLPFPGERDGTNQNGFVEFVPYNPLTHLVQMTFAGAVMTQRVVSPNPPVIAITALNVDSLNQNVSLDWDATDADGDLLYFTVQYSADGGSTWNTLKLDYLWQSITISSTMLHGSAAARLA